MIKGHTQIILKDAKTGEVMQKVEDDNMVTNALQYVIDICAAMNYSMDHVMRIATNALGGIFLFDNTLKEDPENIYFPGGNCHLVGYGDRGSNNADTMRGTLNASESGYIQGGYKSVWDFGTSQANGTIKSVALTSAYAGSLPEVNLTITDSCWRSNGFSDQNREWFPVAYEEPYVYEAKMLSENRFQIAKLRVPVHEIGVEDYAHMADGWYKAEIVTDVTLQPFDTQRWYCSDDASDYYGQDKTNKRGDVTHIYPRYFKDGKDGYFYGVSHTGNDMYLFTCKYSDGSFEITNTVECNYDASVSFIGNMNWEGWSNRYSSTPHERTAYSNNDFMDKTWAVANGYIYILKSNRKSVYRISLTNTAEIVEFPVYTANDRDYVDSLYCNAERNGMLHLKNIAYDASGNTHVKASLLYEDGTVIIPSIYTNSWSDRYNGRGHTYYYDDASGRGNKLERFWKMDFNQNGNYGDSIGLFFDTNYLGTINNLPSAITKNASQTMKIIYTLTDVEDDTK